jgi:pyruvate/2-oxoglutarate dehydrogenase complex dihydrolipoamide acyltransferase (E2) component
MPTNILMPALSPTMEEGKLAKWLIKEGQTIKAGDIIAEIETDKATMEVEASDEGKVAKLLVPEGTEGVKVNTPIAVLEGEGAVAKAPSISSAPPTTTSAAHSPPTGGEGLGVGGAPTASVLRSPPPPPSPTRGEGADRALGW